MTIAERYDPAMTITEEKEADAYFEVLVVYAMRTFGKSREEAERDERTSLGYYAAYFGRETRERVEKLFDCEHPVFGPVSVELSPEELVLRGMRWASKVTDG